MNKYNPETGLKRCCKCKQYLPIEQFPRSRANADGYNHQCKSCRNGKPYGFKYCQRCKETKAFSEFSLDPQGKHGLGRYCQQCFDEVAAKKPNYVNGLKRCTKCRVYKSPDEFSKDKGKADGLSSHCKQCVGEYQHQNADRLRESQRKYYKKNPSKHATYQREYAKRVGYRHQRIACVKRMARKANLPNTLTTREWKRALEYFHDCCAVCGRQLNDLFKSRTASADHWIPLSKDGGTTALNIIPLCHGVDGCNNHKKDKLPEEWLIEQFGSKKAKKILARINGYFAWVKAQV